VVVDLGPDPATRKRRQKWHSGYRTRREAERARTEILSGLDHGTYVEPSPLTVKEFLTQWLESSRPRVRPTTWASYERALRCHILPTLGELPLQRLTPATLNALYVKLLVTKSQRGEPLSPKTVRNTHIVLRRALQDSVRWNLVPRNAADLADPPRTSRVDMRVWSAEQLRTFLEVSVEHPLHVAWFLAGTTGMRRGEVLGLRWRDVDLDAGRLAVTRAITTANNQIIVTEPKTARSRRSIALDTATIARLRQHRKGQLETRLLMGAAYEHQDLVVAEPDGSPIPPDRLSRQFERELRKGGLPVIRFHDLRHTHATMALAAGVHPKVVSDRLGHANVSITLDVYSHAVPAMEAAAAEAIAALVFDGQ
jgi:integrase